MRGEFVRNHVHEPVLDVGIEPAGRAESLQPDLDACDGDEHATLRARIDLRMFGQGCGDSRPGDVSHLGELVQAVRTGIEVVVLELIGSRITARGVVDFIE